MNEQELDELKKEIEFIKAVIKMNVPNLDAMRKDWINKTGLFASRDL